jgi:hypothetical protein
VSCRVVSCRVVSCRVVSCRVVSCRLVRCVFIGHLCRILCMRTQTASSVEVVRLQGRVAELETEKAEAEKTLSEVICFRKRLYKHARSVTPRCGVVWCVVPVRASHAVRGP